MSAQKKANSVKGKPSGSKNIKKGGSEHHQPQMKLVTSDTCVRCQSRCARGIAYMEKMSQPGAVGLGTPCPLTLK
ncbi:hypothetical protein DNHGIG_04320 [Collibacillus ludicampi]|jgi:hypothetical protein|uniref:Uncharacterized protein n=1 Tax=Collibacillus ludicampi TaxID=2771369 RepID=A0AAV4LB12_9BACL|nr:hypothetical protein [Collibacillus ludicampi]GIM44883.1 hypothetical protein DNHGIG_04320 [Collibacillus ludicampi]